MVLFVKTSATYVVRRSGMLNFNMPLHRTCFKRFVVCNYPFFPFCLLLNQSRRYNMREMEHHNCQNWSQSRLISIVYDKKMPMHRFVTISNPKQACLCKVNNDVIRSSSLLVKFVVFILTPLEEDVVPLKWALHGLTCTTWRTFASSSNGVETSIGSFFVAIV
jgi:hypothetical protein